MGVFYLNHFFICDVHYSVSQIGAPPALHMVCPLSKQHCPQETTVCKHKQPLLFFHHLKSDRVLILCCNSHIFLINNLFVIRPLTFALQEFLHEFIESPRFVEEFGHLMEVV